MPVHGASHSDAAVLARLQLLRRSHAEDLCTLNIASVGWHASEAGRL